MKYRLDDKGPIREAEIALEQLASAMTRTMDSGTVTDHAKGVLHVHAAVAQCYWLRALVHQIDKLISPAETVRRRADGTPI